MSCGYDSPTSWQSFSSTQMSGEQNIKEAPSLPFQRKGIHGHCASQPWASILSGLQRIWLRWSCYNWMPRHKNQMWWIVSESMPTLPGVLWILQHERIYAIEFDSCGARRYTELQDPSWKLILLAKQGNTWLAKFFQDQTGTDNGFTLDVLRFPSTTSSQPPGERLHVTAVRCLEAQLIRRWLVPSKALHSWGQDLSKETEGLLCILCSREWRDGQEPAWEILSTS